MGFGWEDGSGRFQVVAGSEGCCRFPVVDWQRFEKSKHATRTSAILQRYLIEID